MKPTPAAQALRQQGQSLRHLATSPDGWKAPLPFDGKPSPRGDLMRGPRGPEYVAPFALSPMELIDDAYAFEVIADKIDALK